METISFSFSYDPTSLAVGIVIGAVIGMILGIAISLIHFD